MRDERCRSDRERVTVGCKFGITIVLTSNDIMFALRNKQGEQEYVVRYKGCVSVIQLIDRYLLKRASIAVLVNALKPINGMYRLSSTE